MELSMPVVWSDRCLLHEPAAEIWVGVPGPAAETPARAQAILDALDARVAEPLTAGSGAGPRAACILAG